MYYFLFLQEQIKGIIIIISHTLLSARWAAPLQRRCVVVINHIDDRTT
jgi:hypothetical protein